MWTNLETTLARLNISLDLLPFAGIALGMFILVVAVARGFGGGDAVLRRVAAQGRGPTASADRGILRIAPAEPSGLMKTLIPADARTRTAIQRQLAAAGLTGVHALRDFYLLRLTLGVLIPLGFALGLMGVNAGLVLLPAQIDLRLTALERPQIMTIIAVMIGVGFFGPQIWLKNRMAKRQLAISQAFPNALDLVQISVEAGLGFDAAMIRVGNEIAAASPQLSEEFLTAQREIVAGRDRDRALLDMAERTGVEEVQAFANVVLQSMHFGTAIAGTLSAYAVEMRLTRELKAQEMANKLPVKMSALMAGLMLPALLAMTLGPVIIRYIRYAAG